MQVWALEEPVVIIENWDAYCAAVVGAERLRGVVDVGIWLGHFNLFVFSVNSDFVLDNIVFWAPVGDWFGGLVWVSWMGLSDGLEAGEF